MGAFTTRSNIIIENQPGWEPGEFITIKGVLTAEDMDQMGEQQSKPDAQGNVQMIVKTSSLAMLERMVVDWHLLGDGNKPVPLYNERGQKNRRALARLPQAYVLPVLTALDGLSTKEAIPDPEDSSFSANGHLPGSFVEAR